MVIVVCGRQLMSYFFEYHTPPLPKLRCHETAPRDGSDSRRHPATHIFILYAACVKSPENHSVLIAYYLSSRMYNMVYVVLNRAKIFGNTGCHSRKVSLK